jgi:hypothetical protein
MLMLFLRSAAPDAAAQEQISLAGQWSYQLDSSDIGIQQQWFLQRFDRFVWMMQGWVKSLP